jgi:hypothetical protein
MSAGMMKNLVIPVMLSFLPLAAEEEGWVELFNGRDLSGWTPKITGHALGVNAHETFRVEDGILKAEYDRYEEFNNQFGHLYSEFSYSHFILRLEYRFSGEKMKDAPGYVNLNSGVMFHSQPPQSMSIDQAFPVSLEFQFLADEGNGPRATGNVCTPGTDIHVDGKLVKDHIVTSSAPSFPAEEWVAIELEVHGDELVIHRVNGKEVLRYTGTRLDPEGGVVATAPLIAKGQPLKLSHGHIALQAEGQGVWFRKIRLKPLE